MTSWTNEDDNLIVAMMATHTHAQIAQRLGRPLKAVQQRSISIRARGEAADDAADWTPAMDELISEAKKGDLPELARHLGLKVRVLKARRQLLRERHLQKTRSDDYDDFPPVRRWVRAEAAPRLEVEGPRSVFDLAEAA